MFVSSSTPRIGGDFSGIAILVLGITSFVFMAISTFVLTFFAEALVWAGLSTAKAIGILEKKDSTQDKKALDNQ